TTAFLKQITEQDKTEYLGQMVEDEIASSVDWAKRVLIENGIAPDSVNAIDETKLAWSRMVEEERKYLEQINPIVMELDKIKKSKQLQWGRLVELEESLRKHRYHFRKSRDPMIALWVIKYAESVRDGLQYTDANWAGWLIALISLVRIRWAGVLNEENEQKLDP